MGILGKISRSIKDPKKAIIRNVNRVDDYTGKKVFGNTVGFKRNFAGSRSNSKLDETLKESNPRAYNLAKNQFLLLDKIYDDSIISKIKSKFDQLMENEQTSVIVAQHKGQIFSRHIIRPMQTLPELEELLIKYVTDIITGYYGKNFQIKQVVGYRNYHVPSEISSKYEMFSDHWHCDRRNTSEMKLFVCLSNVTESDGPFHVQSMERTRYLMDAGFGTREDYNVPKEILDDPDSVSYTHLTLPTKA